MYDHLFEGNNKSGIGGSQVIHLVSVIGSQITVGFFLSFTGLVIFTCSHSNKY